jgi:hypothetical protein
MIVGMVYALARGMNATQTGRIEMENMAMNYKDSVEAAERFGFNSITSLGQPVDPVLWNMAVNKLDKEGFERHYENGRARGERFASGEFNPEF